MEIDLVLTLIFAVRSDDRYARACVRVIQLVARRLRRLQRIVEDRLDVRQLLRQRLACFVRYVHRISPLLGDEGELIRRQGVSRLVDQNDTLERGDRGHHALEDQAVGSGGDTILRRDENRNGVFVDTDLHYLDLLFLDHRHYRYRRVHVDLLLVAVLLGDEVRERLAGYVDHV